MKASENAPFLPRKAYFVMLQIPRVYFVWYFKVVLRPKMWIGGKVKSNWQAPFSLYKTWALQVMDEMSSLWKGLCARNFGSSVVPCSLPAGKSFLTKGRSFRSTFFANCSNLWCFRSLYQVLVMWSIWIIFWASRGIMHSQATLLRDAIVKYCTALCGHSYLWFNLRMRTSLS